MNLCLSLLIAIRLGKNFKALFFVILTVTFINHLFCAKYPAKNFVWIISFNHYTTLRDYTIMITSTLKLDQRPKSLYNIPISSWSWDAGFKYKLIWMEGITVVKKLLKIYIENFKAPVNLSSYKVILVQNSRRNKRAPQIIE